MQSCNPLQNSWSSETCRWQMARFPRADQNSRIPPHRGADRSGSALRYVSRTSSSQYPSRVPLCRCIHHAMNEASVPHLTVMPNRTRRRWYKTGSPSGSGAGPFDPNKRKSCNKKTTEGWKNQPSSFFTKLSLSSSDFGFRTRQRHEKLRL